MMDYDVAWSIVMSLSVAAMLHKDHALSFMFAVLSFVLLIVRDLS